MYIHLCMHINIFKVFKVAYYIHKKKKRFNQSQMQIDVFNVFNRYIIIHCVRVKAIGSGRNGIDNLSDRPLLLPCISITNHFPVSVFSVAFIRKVVRGPGVGLGVEVVSPRYRINSIYLDIEWSYLEFDCTGLR